VAMIAVLGVVVGMRRRLVGVRAVVVMRVGQAAVVPMAITIDQFIGLSGHS
jgi:hypothetical protein